MPALIRMLLIVLVLGGAGFGAYRFRHIVIPTASDSNSAAEYLVTRRTIEDRVVERGTIESQNTVYGKCELPGWQNKIIWIVPEGTAIKKGMEVAKLEAEEINQQIAQKRVALNEAKGKLQQSKQELDIQINKGASDVATAQLEWELAKLDLVKYEKGDFVAEKADQERAIKEAEAALEKAREDLRNMALLVKKGYRELAQLRELELRVDGWAFQVERDKQKLFVLDEYTFTRQITELRAKAEESERKLARAKTTAEAEKLKVEGTVANAENAVKLHEDELKSLEDVLAKCTLTAPQDGTVAYANTRWMDPSERIREGTTVRSQQDIFYLPDMTNMQVKASIHESVIDRIEVGQKASIRLDAFSEKLEGEVSYVSELAASTYSDAKNYDATVVIKKIPEGMPLKPGMTAEVDILVGTYTNVVAVPVGAITEHFQQTFVYVLNGSAAERRLVSTGRMTHAFVEIIDGLEVGEVVALDAYQRGIDDFAEAERSADGESSTPAVSASPNDAGAT